MAELVRSLVELGFSEYEARTYSGLVSRAPMTGYAVAKETGVPQPKVYETLGRLAERGAVVKIGDDPAKWVAMPPARLLAQMESDFSRRLARAELELSRVKATEDGGQRVRPFWEAGSWQSIQDAAVKLIDDTAERLYLSAHAEQLTAIEGAIEAADQRGVRVDVLCFGKWSLELRHGDVVHHRSTEGTVYPHHQARHLALAADGSASLWALARTGTDWVGIWMDQDDLLPAVVKGFVRHDLFVQRMYRDLRSELRERYGPNLEGLVDPTRAAARLGGEEDAQLA